MKNGRYVISADLYVETPNRAERAEAEFANERARTKVLLELLARCLVAAGESDSAVRAAIDAAMKEDRT